MLRRCVAHNVSVCIITQELSLGQREREEAFRITYYFTRYYLLLYSLVVQSEQRLSTPLKLSKTKNSSKKMYE
jgi:hypothetical protein